MALVSDKIKILRRFVKDLTTLTKDSFDGDGTTTAFRVKNTAIIEDSYVVEVDSVQKTETTDYTFDLDTGDITFLSAPASGSDNVTVVSEYANLRDTEWLEIFNNVISEWEEKVWTESIDETTLTTVANQDDYSLDSISTNVIALLGLWYKTSSTSTSWASVDSATNVSFYKEQNLFNLRPPIDVAGYPIRVRYLEPYDLFTATTDTWDIVDKYFPAFQYFSAVEYFDRFLANMANNLGAKTKTITYEAMSEIRQLAKQYETRAEKLLARVRPRMPAISIPTIINKMKS